VSTVASVSTEITPVEPGRKSRRGGDVEGNPERGLRGNRERGECWEGEGRDGRRGEKGESGERRQVEEVGRERRGAEVGS